MSRRPDARWLIAVLVWLLVTVAAAVRAAPATRVISLAPHTTELAYAAGMGAVLIAASDWSDYPPAAQKLERVASWQGINSERILALKPDLVLAWRGGNPQRALDQLAAFGIPIIYIDPHSVADIASALQQLAPYSPQPQQAIVAAQALLTHQQQLRQQYADVPARRVFMQFGSRPLFTAGADTLQSQVLRLCGGHNIFADSALPWPQVSREQVLFRQPQVIVTTGNSAQRTAIRTFWQPQMDIPVIMLNEDWFNRAGPRILLAADRLCQALAALDTRTGGGRP